MFVQDLRLVVSKREQKNVITIECTDDRELESIKSKLLAVRVAEKKQFRISGDFLEIGEFELQTTAIEIATAVVHHLLENHWVHSNKPYYTMWQGFQKETGVG